MGKRRDSTEQLGITPLKEGNSYNWSFQIDKIHDYAYWDKFLSKEECQTIINLGKSKKLLQGSVLGGGVYPSKRGSLISKVRECSISWLAPSDNLDWLYKRLTDTITLLNKKYFGFHLSGIQEGLQFTHYKAPKDKFDYHMDRSYNYQIRKLSITIQLSNPKDYTGGELELLHGSKSNTMEKNQGRLIIFPSLRS